MKLNLICALLALGVGVAAHADEFKINGTVKTGSCTPTFENGGNFSIGRVSTAALTGTDVSNGYTYTTLSEVSHTLSLHCGSAAKVGLNFADTKASSQIFTSKAEFGLGMDGTTKIGAYEIIPINSANVKVTIGGVPKSAVWTASTDSGVTWGRPRSGMMVFGEASEYWGIVDSVAPDWNPSSTTDMVFDLKVKPYINNAVATLGHDINLNGQATISLHYF
ncbi:MULTISPECIES: DUF1120 domain-containing protein [unclassified Paludibacterium]|uniref:DUF1120 domain-containing protein n=1 Tax=unclassified Paludibacterium TaxID=2618429 RepID=UPI001C0535B7|nr:DUF1120 domain-containing protein [Paludibacterium sp. B53371]BEV71862.1 hypothetical protein THUN1379_13440 [Paludibacterium sp. THUN1379]